MKGPTHLSALIHAATMVVAGVYLVARMFPLFIGYAPDVLHLVAYVGAFTAFYAASVACVQSDIKRVLAFSTISQIGFMMVALGVCTSADPHHGGLGYMAGMFHLFTHAMFKALLFLGAGSIIHAVHSNEMSAMGGLRKYMPVARSHMHESEENVIKWTTGVQYEPVFRLGNNMMESFSRLNQVERLMKKFPGLDRVSCGPPT